MVVMPFIWLWIEFLETLYIFVVPWIDIFLVVWIAWIVRKSWFSFARLDIMCGCGNGGLYGEGGGVGGKCAR